MNTNKRIVIIGGVAGGASAAARARRLDEQADITLIERGPDVSFANCGLPYHIGGEIADRDKLAVQTPESLQRQLAIKVRVNTEAVAIERESKTVKLRSLQTGLEESLTYDKLILSPGASPLKPPLPGIDLPGIFTLRNLQDMDRIKEALAKAERVLVIGAGFIGLEMAEQLIHLGKQVSLVELVEQVLPQMDAEMTRPVEQELLNNGVTLVLGDGIKGFTKCDGDAIQAELNSGKTLQGDLVILSIGVRPESGLARDAGLELGPRGHIKTNSYMQTSDPDIYAVGDVCEGLDPILGGPSAIPLGGPANRQGRSAADHIINGEHARPYPGSIGTAIVRVFDIAAGVTGHSEKRLQQMGIDYQKTIVTDFNHAGYFPGATHLTIKLLWERESGRILGGQVSGYEGVDKRLDVLATAIKGKLTVEDLAHLELAYAPPFGAAKDPLNTAGFSATNMRDGLIEPIYEMPQDNSVQLLDARPVAMAEVKPIPGAKNIPFPELRSRLGELDKSRPVVTICALGKMSYFAARILMQHGFEARAHIGGWKVAAPLQQPATNNYKDISLSNATPPNLSISTTASTNTTASMTSSNSGSAGTITTATTDATPSRQSKTVKLDATGLACPGPILKVKVAADALERGDVLEVSASDAGFLSDFPAFCKANGLECLDIASSKGIVTGRLRKPDTCPIAQQPGTVVEAAKNGATIVVFSGELDKAMAAFVIANGAVAMGGKATLFFTFWGLNVLRKDNPPPVEGKTFMDNMFGMMMPQGVNKLPLSSMHMAGMGTEMMKGRMAAKNLPNLPGLMKSAIDAGVRMVACTMSMEAMGIRKEELIDGVELGGVAEYLGAAQDTHANLFI